MKPKKAYNRSLERALKILCVFSDERRDMNLSDLSRALDLPKSTVYRLCNTLAEYNFLKYDTNRAMYSLGLKLFDLGRVVLSSFSLREDAAPYLAGLQSRCGETAFLGILQDDQLMYLDKRENRKNPIQFRTDIGTRRPPYFGVLGQVLLSSISQMELDRILNKFPIKPITKKSVKNLKELNLRLKKISKQGYALERGDVTEGVEAIAAPIRNHLNKVVAAVGIRFLHSSVNEEKEKQLILEVCTTAEQISEEIGCSQKKDPLAVKQNKK